MGLLPRNGAYFIEHLRELAVQVRKAAIAARRSSTLAGKQSLTDVARETAADTIYELDTHIEPVLEEFCQRWSRDLPLVLIAEGIEDQQGREGMKCFPAGTRPDDAAFRLIVDPIDGTRGLMYDKRSGWLLAGVAGNNGSSTRLSDIGAAVQVEIPTSKQNQSDVLFAVRGAGVHAVREDLDSGRTVRLELRPSTASDLAHGFGSVVSFFPGTKVLAAELMESISAHCGGGLDPGRPLVFDDQYISTGGQLYEVMVGHDRFVADVRPHFYHMTHQTAGLCAHAYDLSAMLIAQEAGVVLSNGLGGAVDGVLDVTTPIGWVAYANTHLRDRIEPVMMKFFSDRGLSAR
jgi:hypothetical protein